MNAEVIGVASSRALGYGDYQAQGLNFATPVELVKEQLALLPLELED